MKTGLNRRNFLKTIGAYAAFSIPDYARGRQSSKEKTHSQKRPNIVFIMADDPYEKIDLWTKHPDVVERLTNLLDKYKEQGYSRPL